MTTTAGNSNTKTKLNSKKNRGSLQLAAQFVCPSDAQLNAVAELLGSFIDVNDSRAADNEQVFVSAKGHEREAATGHHDRQEVIS